MRWATALAWATFCGMFAHAMRAHADAPQLEIANGPLRVQVYLPDAGKGYYRATRFDWSGVISSLQYKGHDYYGQWFDRVDPHVHDFQYVGSEIVASPCTAMSGPAEEFQTHGSALGWDEAKPGGTFIKIGVGVLRKDDAAYDFVKLYQIVDPGKWTVAKRRDAVEFEQEVADPSSGYAYVYTKKIALVKDKPEMVLEHRLKNTGRRVIRSTVYNHNFLVLDKQSPGPDFTITVPFRIQPVAHPLVDVRGDRIVYRKVLENQDVAEIPVRGFGSSARDNEIRIENRKVGAGVKITGDRPLSDGNLWSIRTVLAMEPFISLAIEPGKEVTWQTRYQYYTLP